MKWQPIETAPIGSPILLSILCRTGHWTVMVGIRHTEDGLWYLDYPVFDEIGTNDEPTHWMPLPAPPMVKKELK